tara:strand:- start:201 stop:344 length:144 start_codon:yes stop_codon:yes gene_type:complete
MRLPPSQFLNSPINSGLFPAQTLEPPRLGAFAWSFDDLAMHLPVSPV